MPINNGGQREAPELNTNSTKGNQMSKQSKTETTDLVVINPEDAVKLFTGNAIDLLIDELEGKLKKKIQDTSTVKGRKAIASTAYKVSKSKVLVDDLGKGLVADWKLKSKKVDASRRKIRERFDALRDKYRKPLTDWETEEKERKIAAKLAAEVEKAHGEALIEEDMLQRNRDIERREKEYEEKEAKRRAAEAIIEEKKRKEEELKKRALEKEALRLKIIEEAKAEAELKLKEEKEAVEREKAKLEREAELLKQQQIEATAKAKADALQKEKDVAEAIEKAKAEKAAKAKAIEEQKEALQALKKKNAERLEQLKREKEENEAKAKLEAIREQELAIEKAKQEAQDLADKLQKEREEKEAEALKIKQEKEALEKEEKRIAEEKAADEKNIVAVNAKAVQDLCDNGLSLEDACRAIIVIAENKISNVTIQY